MKNVKSIFGAMVLGLVLTSAAYAGDVSTPGFLPPLPPPPSSATLATTETREQGEIGPNELAIEILMAALSTFYQ